MIPLGVLASARVGTVAAPSFVGGLEAWGAAASYAVWTDSGPA